MLFYSTKLFFFNNFYFLTPNMGGYPSTSSPRPIMEGWFTIATAAWARKAQQQQQQRQQQQQQQQQLQQMQPVNPSSSMSVVGGVGSVVVPHDPPPGQRVFVVLDEVSLAAYDDEGWNAAALSAALPFQASHKASHRSSQSFSGVNSITPKFKWPSGKIDVKYEVG